SWRTFLGAPLFAGGEIADSPEGYPVLLSLPTGPLSLSASYHFRKEFGQVRGLNCRATVLACFQRTCRGIVRDLNRALACGARIGRRQPTFSYLFNQVVHVDVDLRRDLSSTDTPRFSRLSPHAEAFIDTRGILVSLGVDEVDRVSEGSLAPKVLGHLLHPTDGRRCQLDVLENPGAPPGSCVVSV
ncbi:MAG: hypothetical protein AABX97_06870, partial [Candidatus Thermoplasmatota archaeon]